jgi:hypothetical protein
MHRFRCLVVIIGASAVVVGGVAAGPAAAAKGGNNGTAKACQQGGWKTLVPNGGGTFANQGDCVNDGAQGSPPSLGSAGQGACQQIGGSFRAKPPTHVDLPIHAQPSAQPPHGPEHARTEDGV